MVRRTQKACQVCGKPFYGGMDCFYCPKCAKDKKLDTVVKIRTCQDCGIEFYGGPRAKRCPECAIVARRETAKTFRHTGAKRPIGSTDKCAVCGKEYTVVSGRQKYCSEGCQRKGVLDWQREHKQGYHRASGQDVKKQERREQQEKICVYCLRRFKTANASNLCSDFCRAEQKKLVQCIADSGRGYNCNLKKYEEMRTKYREAVKNDG